jgi:hypothetical protein
MWLAQLFVFLVRTRFDFIVVFIITMAFSLLHFTGFSHSGLVFARGSRILILSPDAERLLPHCGLHDCHSQKPPHEVSQCCCFNTGLVASQRIPAVLRYP